MFTTNNNVLVNNWKQTPTIMCIQKSAEKHIVTEDLLRQANKLSFGNNIGAITNRATGMFDLLPLFDKDSKMHKELLYRITCIQHYQQNSIDKTKGIITKPMLKHWYQRIKPRENEELTEEDIFNNSICVDRKPYFMRYIYPDVNSQYSSYVKGSMNKCHQHFGISFNELLMLDELTEEQSSFIEHYYKYLPVNDNSCVMNRLCHMVENEFDGYTSKLKADSNFDYTILKSGNDYDYKLFLEVLKVYHEYTAKKIKVCIEKNSYKIFNRDFSENLDLITDEFKEKCERICPNEVELCDIALDICYSNKNSKAFAWELFGNQIIKNLLNKNNNKIKYLIKSDNGDIKFNGYRFEERILENVDNE